MLPIPPVQILSNPLPSHHFQPPPSNPTTLFDVLFLYLNGWLCSISWVISLNIMNLRRMSLGNFVPGRPCCVFYATRHQVYWGLTHVVFCCYSNLISHTQASFARPLVLSHQARWHKRIPIKGFSVPWGFSWIENYKLK